jgi:leader peptidase (prepilin peptidase)/N-methyltransferase
MYPAIELITAILFAYSLSWFGIQTELIIALLLISMLMIVLVTDLTYMLIPDKLLLFFLPIFIILRTFIPLDPWWSAPAGMIIGFFLVLLIILISRGGMGAGDMKLFAVLGIILGISKILLTFFLACVIGSVFGLILIQLKRVKSKQPLPFGPYIVIAALIAYFNGDQMIRWYFSLFF